ncbi:cAMP-dependent protein kinase type II regulatory subunit-like [Lingula anatina]|uniref:cAMP-dependent protein kinase type II regulatory subunit-like n=1 Tax=Lingula anatina TaxID=7574 RepID=A0A1S3JN83_LINAN|nr:cAMP-dependent protein kinase type II regulatory subunit-like [Lingula anatina]|eukprot:XP_013411820.1 cAMP-dependent protein kinase type II regulatory subunit-like [Lingula anatina]
MSTARVNNLHGGQCHSMSLEVIVPSGLTDLLTPFVVAVLRDGPDDLVDFAANYFNELREKRQGTLPGMGRGVRFVPGSDDEAMQTDSDDEPMPGESERKSVVSTHLLYK